MFNYKNTKNTIAVTIILLLILLPFAAQAKILDPSTMDKSVEYLATIFGNKINKFFTSQQHPSNLFLSNLFEIFNNLILIISIFVLGYVSILSTINTAQEGQVMGKKWSSVWIPLRSAVGLLLLSPMPGYGYSFLQVIIMWIVLNGVGAANQIWNFVLNNLSQGITISQQEIINRENLNIINKQSVELGKKVFNSLVCTKILNKYKRNQDIPQNLEPYTEFHQPMNNLIDNNQYSIYNVIKFGVKNTDNVNQQNICGEIKISSILTDQDLLNDNNENIPINHQNKQILLHKIYTIKYNAVQIMINKINKLVETLIDTASEKSNKEIVLNQELLFPGILDHVIKEYQQSILNLTKQDLMTWVNLPSSLDRQSISDLIIQQGKEFGWITAGSYFYLLSQAPIKNLLTTAETPNIITSQLFDRGITNCSKLDSSQLGIVCSNLQRYVSAINDKQPYIDNLFNKTEQLIVSAKMKDSINKANFKQIKHLNNKFPKEFIKNPNLQLQDAILQIENKNPKIKPYMDSFFDLHESAIKEIEYSFNSNSDPLISQATFGTKLMQIAEGFWTGITITSLVSEGFSEIFKNNEDQTSMGFIITLLPITLIFSGVIWGIGATLAVYTPMIPYMIFIITALGWFMLVIEAIIAAPIVALGFITPSQDELGKVAPALGIIVNMFLKPTLMLFGLFLAAKLYSTLVNMINLGFKFTLATLQTQAGSSMFSWIVIIILYCGFIITLVNKCYGLIYQLPDKILRWIGLTGEQTDVSSIKETQHLFDQGAKQGIAPVEGMATSASNKLRHQLEHVKNSQSISNHVNATNRDGSGLS